MDTGLRLQTWHGTIAAPVLTPRCGTCLLSSKSNPDHGVCRPFSGLLVIDPENGRLLLSLPTSKPSWLAAHRSVEPRDNPA